MSLITCIHSNTFTIIILNWLQFIYFFYQNLEVEDLVSLPKRFLIVLKMRKKVILSFQNIETRKEQLYLCLKQFYIKFLMLQIYGFCL